MASHEELDAHWLGHRPKLSGPGVLNWAPDRLPDESPFEHLGNALQAMAELESLLLQGGDFTQDRRALVALVKRRVGWARDLVR